MTLAQVTLSLWSSASPSENALLAQARGGNRGAFDALRRLHEAPLLGFVARRVGTQDAQDLAQEIWLACWQALPHFAGRARFKAWLYGIATNKCADCLRRRAQDQRKQEALPATEPEAPDAYQAIALRASVQQALSQVPQEQKEVLELYYYAQLTLSEIGQVLGRNPNTVKYQFYRGHAVVGEVLQGEEGRVR